MSWTGSPPCTVLYLPSRRMHPTFPKRSCTSHSCPRPCGHCRTNWHRSVMRRRLSRTSMGHLSSKPRGALLTPRARVHRCSGSRSPCHVLRWKRFRWAKRPRRSTCMHPRGPIPRKILSGRIWRGGLLLAPQHHRFLPRPVPDEPGSSCWASPWWWRLVLQHLCYCVRIRSLVIFRRGWSTGNTLLQLLLLQQPLAALLASA
jgi:hypothetical protein